MDLRAAQKPLKDRYREDPAASRITLVARAAHGETPIACSVALGRTIYEAQAHPGVGGVAPAQRPARETSSSGRWPRARS
jgi:hypothetical protein